MENAIELIEYVLKNDFLKSRLERFDCISFSGDGIFLRARYSSELISEIQHYYCFISWNVEESGLITADTTVIESEKGKKIKISFLFT